MNRTEAEHVHGEAFMLMTYRSDDGTEDEVIWNSRDGVTPFVVTLRSGKQATHVNWGGDVYAPDHRPQLGERIFVDLTPERAKQHARRMAHRYWDTNAVGCREQFASVDEMAEMAEMLSEHPIEPGEPDLIEVAG